MSRFERVRRDERGATLALVAMSMAGFVGMAALVVDVGSGWLTRETLIPATDAAALAAVQDLVAQPGDELGACATAATYVAENAPAATMAGCEVATFIPDGGRVTITATESLNTTFGDLGGDEPSIQSVSSATWGSPSTVSALRPLALCYDGSSDLRELIDNPPSYPTWVRVSFLKDDPAACGGSSSIGNFATVDFGHDTGISEIRAWMDDGYPGQISFDDLSVVDCDSGAVCYERPYASSNLVWQMAALRDSGRYVVFPVFNFADSNEVHLIGAVRARIDAFQIYSEPGDWYFELEVEPGLVAGTCCGPPGVLSGNSVIAICGVDPGAYVGCEPSPGP